MRSCECAVACLCPRNSISNVVVSLMIHDNIYIYIYISMKPLWKVVQIVRYTWVWVAKDKSNTDCQSGSQQARVNGESNHDNVISAQCSECQSVEKTFAKDVVIDHERKSKGIEDINRHRLNTFNDSICASVSLAK